MSGFDADRRLLTQLLAFAGISLLTRNVVGNEIGATSGTASGHSHLKLDSIWSPGLGIQLNEHAFILSSQSDEPLSGFAIALSGPQGLRLGEEVRNGVVRSTVGEAFLIEAPPGLTVVRGSPWRFSIAWPSNSPRKLAHWTDSPHTAYVVTAQRRLLDVLVAPCRPADDLHGRPVGLLAGNISRAANGAQSLAVTPWPIKVEATGVRSGRHALVLADEPAANAFRELVSILFPDANVISRSDSGIPVKLRQTEGLHPEGYKISFAKDDITVDASTSSGSLYGLITLGQIVRGAASAPDRFILPLGGEIVDAPTHRWRGCMLDVSRQFFPIEDIRRFIAILAWNKMNRFHWHLTDDEGWRLQIGAYPTLTEVGAWRGHEWPIPAVCGSGAERYGGFYSRGDLRGAVALAASFGIEIVPEIDMPGHSFAAVTSVPSLRDPSESALRASVQGFPGNVLNPGLRETQQFVEAVLEEVIDVFPSNILHVGGDEVSEAAWANSPAARARLVEIGQSSMTELRASFLREVQTFLKKKGKVTAAWQEAADGSGLAREGALMFAWKNPAAGPMLANKGYDLIMTPGRPYYLNTAYSDDWWEPGSGSYGSASPELTYSFDPLAGISVDRRAQVLGIQASIWTNLMDNPAVFERLVFPRLSAVADTAWSGTSNKDWQRFSQSAALMPTLFVQYS